MPVDQVKESLPADAITEDMRVKKAMDLVRDTAVITDEAPEAAAKKPAAKKPAAKKPAAKKTTAKAKAEAEAEKTEDQPE